MVPACRPNAPSHEPVARRTLKAPLPGRTHLKKRTQSRATPADHQPAPLRESVAWRGRILSLLKSRERSQRPMDGAGRTAHVYGCPAGLISFIHPRRGPSAGCVESAEYRVLKSLDTKPPAPVRYRQFPDEKVGEIRVLTSLRKILNCGLLRHTNCS
jgi:hypothetical protein